MIDAKDLSEYFDVRIRPNVVVNMETWHQQSGVYLAIETPGTRSRQQTLARRGATTKIIKDAWMF
jgi:hypothetical protein